MRALLLAAGLGTRLRPLTFSIPKCLVKIRGKPLLQYWFEHLFSAGVDRVLVNTHWFSDQVQAHIASSSFRDRIDLAYEVELLGTGGTVLANRAWFGQQPFMVCHADNLTNFDVSAFIDAHARRAAGCSITMLAFETDSPQTCGILETDQAGIVRAFHEKVAHPPGNLANAAVYIFEPEVIDLIESLGQTNVDISTQVLPRFIGRIQSVQTHEYHRDLGNLRSLQLAQTEYPE